jgi:hypothetical protein
MITSQTYRGTLISKPFSKSQINRAAEDYRLMLLSVLSFILDRYERDPAYGFIDTKINVSTGIDFEENDPIRGKRIIYSWIQGRALEALAAHYIWLGQCPELDLQVRTNLANRIRVVLFELLDRMEKLRKANNGRLVFMITPDGVPLRISENGNVVSYELRPDAPANYSDLFYVKGLAAAAYVLELKDKLSEACDLFMAITKDILENRFISDQQQFDVMNISPKNKGGRYTHCPRMIGISAASRFLKCTKDPEFQKIGFEFLDYVLKHYTHAENSPKQTEKFEMWEFINKDGQPYVDDANMLISDPGHACEFTGIALDFIRTSESYSSLTPTQTAKVTDYKSILPNMLKKNFGNGFLGKGICKTFDLISRRPYNSNMPWWSLPETMKAALLSCSVVTRENCISFAEIAAKCSNAFVRYYIKPDRNLMAIQTVDADGQPSDIIPATPDADPGYHTGLSLIDCLSSLKQFTKCGKSGNKNCAEAYLK